MKYRLVTLMFGLAVLAGCATQGKSSVDISARSPTTVENEIVINEPYSKVWDKLVRELSKSYYVINNIDKESRIINLSFSSNLPQEFVECGSTTRTYTQGNNTQTFKYEIAASSTYRMATPRQPDKQFAYYADVIRTTKLEGRSNIYLAPEDTDKSKTRVAVNTRYILSIDRHGQVFAENYVGQVISSAPIPPEPVLTVAFNTNKPVEQTEVGGSFTCYGNGRLEKEILGLLQR